MERDVSASPFIAKATRLESEMAVGQNQWYHVGVGAPPVLVYFSGHWDVHCGYGLLTHGQIYQRQHAVCKG